MGLLPTGAPPTIQGFVGTAPDTVNLPPDAHKCKGTGRRGIRIIRVKAVHSNQSSLEVTPQSTTASLANQQGMAGPDRHSSSDRTGIVRHPDPRAGMLSPPQGSHSFSADNAHKTQYTIIVPG